ncbi:MAG: hypothetical protein JXR56_04285, partial [Candidatus Cloacimonetes bacterium]|nr:hypothetical protein [Candidatus Cloacimonadota bacterium]
MKKLSLFVVILLALSICRAQNSASATYTSGDVQLVYHWENPTPPSPSQTPLSLNVSVPLGARITSVDVSYDIRTDVPNGAQNTLSYLECTSDGGTYETSMSSSNNAYSPVTVHFSRTGLNIANNVIGGGDISFTLHPFDEQGGWCISYVANNTFTVTVHYSDLFDLGEFVGQANGVGEVILNWQNNNNPANTLIVTNSVEEFVDPVDGVTYSVGDNIGTATVLYYGTGNQFNHTGV